jgi:hypothetical protein
MYALQLGREFNELKVNLINLQKNILRIQYVFLIAIWHVVKNAFLFLIERPRMVKVHGLGVHEVVEHRYIEVNF